MTQFLKKQRKVHKTQAEAAWRGTYIQRTEMGEDISAKHERRSELDQMLDDICYWEWKPKNK